ncbi:hypothetical protein [Yersinia ruckeri]|uniref:hypothetical protein n=1 Tax=Yersinia ruckeri TaxID=29486 RepID=UPI0023EF1F79|nr:hypothetical protein [Yersinia ruckeri]
MKKIDIIYDIINNQKKTLSIVKSTDTIIVRMHQGKEFLPIINNAIKKQGDGLSPGVQHRSSQCLRGSR